MSATNTPVATADMTTLAESPRDALSPDADPHNANPFNLKVIEEFRANGGRVGGAFAGTDLLLLTTRGARSGLARTTPVVYLPDGGDRLVVFASNGGSPTAPHWYRNLVANPEVVVEVGRERYAARAVPVDASEHDELWRRQIAVDGKFAAFRARAGRVVPLVALVRSPGPSPEAQ